MHGHHDREAYPPLPVVDDEKFIGIVSIGDLVKTIIDDQKFTIEQLEHYIHGERY